MALNPFPELDKEVIWTRQPQGQVFYVSVTGNDNNPGNRRNPLRTIAAALAKCVDLRGDTVIIGSSDGTGFAENVTIDKRCVTLTGLALGSSNGSPTILGQAGGPALLIRANFVQVQGLRVRTDVSGQVACKISDELGSAGVGYMGNVTIRGPFDGTGIGLWLFGAQGWRFEDLLVRGADIGIGMGGGVNLNPQSLEFSEIFLSENNSADFATMNGPAVGDSSLFDVNIHECGFVDTLVTKHINFVPGGGAANQSQSVLIWDVWFNRAVVAGNLVSLGAKQVLLGRDRTGDISIVGA